MKVTFLDGKFNHYNMQSQVNVFEKVWADKWFYNQPAFAGALGLGYNSSLLSGFNSSEWILDLANPNNKSSVPTLVFGDNLASNLTASNTSY